MLVVPPELEVLGLIVTVAVLGWNEVKVCWLVPVLDGMIPRTFCCTWTTPWKKDEEVIDNCPFHKTSGIAWFLRRNQVWRGFIVGYIKCEIRRLKSVKRKWKIMATVWSGKCELKLFTFPLPPCVAGTFTATILLFAGSGSLVITFPAIVTGLPVIWNVWPVLAMVVADVAAVLVANGV